MEATEGRTTPLTAARRPELSGRPLLASEVGSFFRIPEEARRILEDGARRSTNESDPEELFSCRRNVRKLLLVIFFSIGDEQFLVWKRKKMLEMGA